MLDMFELFGAFVASPCERSVKYLHRKIQIDTKIADIATNQSGLARDEGSQNTKLGQNKSEAVL